MSTLYNRRRGAKANAKRTMRRCAMYKLQDETRPMPGGYYARDAVRCIRFAERNRYCSDHQTVRQIA